MHSAAQRRHEIDIFQNAMATEISENMFLILASQVHQCILATTWAESSNEKTLHE